MLLDQVEQFDIKGKVVTVFGAQRTAQAVATLVEAQGGHIQVTSYDPKECVDVSFTEWIQDHDVKVEYGQHSRDFLMETDIIVLSPGVSIYTPVIQWAKAYGTLIMGEVEFSSQFCPTPIIAVTGSNGKTTVTHLITQVLEAAGYKTTMCGNVGIPFSQVILEAQQSDYVVLEVSSFQMESLVDDIEQYEDIKPFQPYISVLLNFSQNHLDRHKDLDEYWQAKTKIFKNQTEYDYAVLNAGESKSLSLANTLNPNVFLFNNNTFSKEDYNFNQQAVMSVAEVLHIDMDVCKRVFRTFQGVEHRVETVVEIQGVEFINDAKSTTVEASRWALEQMTKPVIWICGGRDKNLDFNPLRRLAQNKVRQIIAIGECREKIHNTFVDVCPVTMHHDFVDAVRDAYRAAQKHHCVLLSPMCASFDMFQDFEDRGRKFKAIVNLLKENDGTHDM